jgi:galactose mutarotase-like enzyme
VTQRHYACRASVDHCYKGYRTAVLENELLRVTVLVDKGADIVEFLHKPTDTDFLLRTPWGLHPAGKLVPSNAHSLGAFHDYYEGGWQSIFPAAGKPGKVGNLEQGLHGEVALMPWDVQIIKDTPAEVALKFSVRTYRTPFRLTKTLRLRSGVAALFIDQEAENLGGEAVTAMWGEHPALGAPFISPACRIDLPMATVVSMQRRENQALRMQGASTGRWPFAKDPLGRRVDLSKLPPLKQPCADLVFLKDLKAPWYAIRNEETQVGFALAWTPEVFRYLWFWQVYGGAKGYPWWSTSYHCALEPHSSMPDSFEAAHAARNVVTFKPGQKKRARLTAVAFQGSKKIKHLGLDGRLKA